jgi:uncharacterized RDD family membrane protein YckC
VSTVLARQGAALGTARSLRRELVTPEGIALPIQLAGAGERLVAFFVDVLVIALLLFVTAQVARLLPDEIGGPLLQLGAFVLVQFYFTIGELHGQGATRGKRWLDLRVVDVRGGRLSAVAIFTRDVMRIVEVQLPLFLIAQSKVADGEQPKWVVAAVGGWALVLGAFPLFNRDRRRIGDLAAGTLVVHVPRAVLLPDLSHVELQGALPESADEDYRFTPEQLSVYGVYELQVLEDVLRSDRPDRQHALRLVCEKVVAKIGYRASGPIVPTRFLSAFYAAQRARLEQELLFGRRKSRKSG